MFRKKLKKVAAVLIVILLLPYMITVFMNGKMMEVNKMGHDNYIKVNKDGKETEVLLEEYCIGMLAKEIPIDYKTETLKAQSVIVRTTVYKALGEGGKKVVMKDHFWTRKEMENQWGRLKFQKNYEKIRKAWEATDGQVVMYDNELAMVPFHQLSNGKTRIGQEVLGSEAYPYLQMKECPKDVEAKTQMESKLIQAVSAEVLTRDSAGYVTSVKAGEETCSGESFRNTYGLASSCFELQEFEGKIRVTTKGVGHGLGMSQNTANEMAKEGKKYKDILQYFFEGTKIKEVAEILL